MSTVKANEYRHLNNSGTESNLTLSSNASVEIGNDLTLPQGNIDVTGNATISGNITANGNAALGNAATDAHTVTGTLAVTKTLAVTELITATAGVKGDVKDTGGNVVVGVGTGNNATFDGDLTGNVTGDVTGNVQGDVTGTATNADHVQVTDNESTDESNLITFVENAQATSGKHGLEMDGNLTYNPSTGTVTSTAFSGNGSALTNLNASNLSSGTIPASRIGTEAITYARMQHVTNARILGNNSGSTGDVSELTGATVTGMLSDATTSAKGAMSAGDKTKLDALPSNFDGYSELLKLHEWTTFYSVNGLSGSGYKSAHATTESITLQSGNLYEFTISFQYEVVGVANFTDAIEFAIGYGTSNVAQGGNIPVTKSIIKIKQPSGSSYHGYLRLRFFLNWGGSDQVVYPCAGVQNQTGASGHIVKINNGINLGGYSDDIFLTVKRYKGVSYTSSSGA